jgi:pyruvate formate lyase activating enzyme
MIRAVIETSLVDWDGKITTVLFFDKCNFMCPFCQNWELILHPEKFPVIPWEDIEKKLVKKEKWVDGVVLTGGEPLIFKKEVFDIARKIKQRNLSVKIDTNGAYPDVLRELLDAHLVDYVAMDIKAPIDERYYKAAGKQIDLENIKESIHILMKGHVEYEFRTTVVPGIIDEDAIKKIGESIQGASLWVLQTYVPKNAYRKNYRGKLDKNYSEQLHQFSSIAKNYAAKVKVRGKA